MANKIEVFELRKGHLVTCNILYPIIEIEPEYGVTSTAARTIRNEKASLDLVTVDFDTDTVDENRVVELLAEIAGRQRGCKHNRETDYCLQNSMAYFSRLVSHSDLNHDFVSKLGETKRVGQCHCPALEAHMENDTIIYGRMNEETDPPGANKVEVHIAARSLSASDGADDSAFLNHEFVGTVIRIGSTVSCVVPCDHIMGVLLQQLPIFQRSPSKLLQADKAVADGMELK